MFRETTNRAPKAPRELTPDMRQDTQSIGRMFRIFGFVWGGLGAAGLVVAGVLALLLGSVVGPMVVPALAALAGGSLLAVGFGKRARARQIFRDGVEVEGQVVSVGLDYRVRVNRRHPWRVIYRYQVNGRSHEGSYSCWTDSPPTVSPGAQVTVLHDPRSPSASVLWTRVAPLAELPAARVAEPQVRVAEGVELEASAEEQQRSRQA